MRSVPYSRPFTFQFHLCLVLLFDTLSHYPRQTNTGQDCKCQDEIWPKEVSTKTIDSPAATKRKMAKVNINNLKQSVNVSSQCPYSTYLDKPTLTKLNRPNQKVMYPEPRPTTRLPRKVGTKQKETVKRKHRKKEKIMNPKTCTLRSSLETIMIPCVIDRILIH